jgi:autoinducer 2-degrading protein
MFGIVFRIEATPGKYQELLEFLKWDGEICRDREPGTVRFEFYRDPNDDNAFFVYEAYRDLDAFEAHKKNEPFQRWGSGLRDTLGTNYTVLFCGDAVWSTGRSTP